MPKRKLEIVYRPCPACGGDLLPDASHHAVGPGRLQTDQEPPVHG